MQLDKLLSLLKSFFTNDNSDNKNDFNNLFVSKNTLNFQNNSSFSNNTNTATLPPKTQDTYIQHQKVIKHVIKNQKKMNYDDVVNLININIAYLHKIGKILEKSIFVDEFNQIKTLTNQSNDCLKLLVSINSDKIFFQNTLKFIIAHAIQVGELTEHLKNIDLQQLEKEVNAKTL